MRNLLNVTKIFIQGVAFPTVPVRLIAPYIKSFLGKNLSEKIHAVRKWLLPYIFTIH